MRNFFLMLMIVWLAAGCAAGTRHFGKGGEAKRYMVKYARIKPEFKGDWAAYWDSPAWRQADTASVDEWSTHSSATRPTARVKVLYDESGIRLLWRVEDSYVVAVYTQPQGMVSRDSAVEFFVEPDKAMGYTSLEINAGGVPYWKAHRPVGAFTTYPPAYREPEAPTTDTARLLQIRHSMPPAPIYPPVEAPMTWYVESFIPIEALGAMFPIKAEDLPGAHWRANFFKLIGQRTEPAIARHQHWATWNPIGPVLKFHQPDKFGDLYFEKKP